MWKVIVGKEYELIRMIRNYKAYQGYCGVSVNQQTTIEEQPYLLEVAGGGIINSTVQTAQQTSCFRFT